MTTPVRQGGDSERLSAGLEHDPRRGSGRQEWPALIGTTSPLLDALAALIPHAHLAVFAAQIGC